MISSVEKLKYVKDNVFEHSINYKENEIFYYYSYYEIVNNKPIIHLIGKTKDGQKIHNIVEDFKPYYYKLTRDKTQYVDIFGNNVERVETEIPAQVKTQRRGIKTYEADIPFVRRFFIDNHRFLRCKTELTKLDVLYVDVETPSLESEDVISVSWKLGDNDIQFETKDFSKLIEDMKSADIIIAWNMDFDEPRLRKLMQKYGIKNQKDFVFLDGIETLRFFLRKELGSWALDNVAEELLGYGKIKSEKMPHEMSEEELKAYNERDVELIYELDKKYKFTENIAFMSYYYVLPIHDVLSISIINDSLLLREFHERNIVLDNRRESVRNDTYSGAEPIAKKGIYENIAVFDFQSFYPHIMVALYISVFNKTRDNKNVVIAANSVNFRKNNDFLVRMMEDLLKLKYELDSEMEKNPSESLKFFRQAVKTQMAALYGMYGWKSSRLYDKEIAEAITSTAKDIIKHVIVFVTMLGEEVIYSHTDSIFVALKKYDAQTLQEKIELFVKQLCKERGYKISIPIKLNGVYKKGYIHSPARNALLNDDGTLTITGLEIKRSETPQFVKEILHGTIKMILDRKAEDEIFQEIRKRISELDNLPYDVIGKRCPYKGNYKIQTQIEKAATNTEKLLNKRLRYGKYYLLPFMNNGKHFDLLLSREFKLPESLKIDKEKYIRDYLARPLSRIMNVDLSLVENKLLNQRCLDAYV